MILVSGHIYIKESIACDNIGQIIFFQVTCVAAVSLTAGSLLSDFFERLLPSIIVKVINDLEQKMII